MPDVMGQTLGQEYPQNDPKLEIVNPFSVLCGLDGLRAHHHARNSRTDAQNAVLAQAAEDRELRQRAEV